MQKYPLEILKHYWGHTGFRGSQETIISSILEKRDVLALLPTGGGKSICFQIPTLIREGLCIVISPLIALIHNQVDDLRKKGIKAIAMTGSIRQTELIQLLDNCLFGNYKFLYLSPERLRQEIVLKKIAEMKVALIAIDEAHCISQWGHDFRPAYLECGRLRDLLPETPVIALTATATNRVVTDIADTLKFVDPVISKDSFSRNNIAFKVIRTEDKRYHLKQLCAEADKSVIVYVRTRRSTVEISNYLNANGLVADFFHGGLPQEVKREKLGNWLDNTVKIMVATNAFGMGIDKADVSLVVHLQIPDCLENYFQEAGRAGRDGEPAEAVLLTNRSDEESVRSRFIGLLPDTPFLKKVYNKLNNYFGIPYGEMVTDSFQFGLHAFCETYKLNTLLTYNALLILDRNSVISLSESFSKKTEIKFICAKDALFDYFEKNRKTALIVQTILRTYGGLFDFETKIDTALIAKKTSRSHDQIVSVLEHLKKDGLITYTARTSDSEVRFLVPREDNSTISAFAKKVEKLQGTKVEKLETMLAYVRNGAICRNRLLLSYFGEDKTQDCGKCDVCTKTEEPLGSPVTAQRILSLLRYGNKSSRTLIAELGLNNVTVVEGLQHLLEDGSIRINSRNEYEITK